jgi:hypothetical protein
VECQRAFKSFLFPREMSVVLFFVSSAIPKWTVELPTFPARRNLIVWNVRIQADENLVVGQLTPFPNTVRVSALKVQKVDDLIWLLYERLYRLDIVIMMILFSSAWRNGIISPENSFQAGERTVCICVIIWPRWNGRTVKLPFGQLVTSRWIGNSLTKSMMRNSSEVYTY